MMTAAVLNGIDSCTVEGFHQEKAEDLLKEKFGIDTDKYGLSFMVAFGYRKAEPPHAKSRRNFNDIVTWKYLKSKPLIMNWISEFLHSERTLYLFAVIIGVISAVVGLLFLIFSNHKSFAITMLVIGIMEIAVMFPTYLKYQQNIDDKISVYKTNEIEFFKSETIATEKALKSFFWLKLICGILIVALILGMYFLSPKSIFFGIFMVLILHLVLAITIDNFGEIYTKKILIELAKAEKQRGISLCIIISWL